MHPHQQILEKISPIEESAIRREEKLENTRNRIALIFIISYLVLLLIMVTLSSFYGLTNEASKDYLLAIGTPLGFIIGYYFKSTNKN